jgi:hypothetical protein
MKVTQCGTFQELSKFLQVHLQKASSVMKKLVLMRAATGKEDPELPLLQGISSFEVPASDCIPNKCCGPKKLHYRPWLDSRLYHNRP